MRGVTASILVLVLAGCTAFQSGPAHTGTTTAPVPVARLSNERYLSARGSGDTPDQAAKAATAALAQIFEADVRAEESLVERYRELMAAGKSDLSATSDLQRSVTIRSGITLHNLRMTDPTADGTGRYVVHAYLDRQETARLYLQKISVNNERIAYFLGESDKTPHAVQQYACLQAAATVAANNKVLLDQLALIHPGARQQAVIVHTSDVLRRQAAEKARGIRFAVDFKGEGAPQVVPIIYEIVTAMGFTVGGPPQLTIAGALTFEPVDLKQSDTVFVRYHFQANVVDPKGVATMAMVTKGREGHISEPEAKARAFRALRDAMQSDLRRQLESYFDRMVLGVVKTDPSGQ